MTLEITDLFEAERTSETIIAHLRLLGPLPADARGVLQHHFSQLAEESPDRRLWLDLELIEYVDDDAFSMLLQLQQQLTARKCRVVVANLGPLVREALVLKRFANILDVRGGLPCEPVSPAALADAGFLQAILEQPEDDAVRLIYADWLEDRGDPRGEFIRIQIEREGLAAGSSGRQELEHLERQMLAIHGARWAASVRWRVGEHTFRRGFIESVALTGSAFVESAAELACLAPIRGLRLYCGWPRVPELLSVLLAWPLLPSLRLLELAHGGLGDAGIRKLAECPRLAKLQRLDLRSNAIGEAGALALAHSPHLTSISTLDLGGNIQIGEEGRHALEGRFGNRGVSF